MVLLGTASGWVIGMLWWVGLMISFGFTSRFLGRLVYAPLVGIPWAVVGLLVGLANAHFRGRLIPVTALSGLFIGFGYSVATSPFDGWLSITMPIESLGGALVGLILGGLVRGAWGWLQGWDE